MDEAIDPALVASFPEDARPEVMAIAEAGAIAARETFGPFNDEDQSPFFEADGLSATGTWEALAERVANTTAYAIVLALSGTLLTPTLITDLHARVFGELFPDAAGQIRRPGEEAQYGIVLGKRDAPTQRAEIGTTPRRILPEAARGMRGVQQGDPCRGR